MNFTAVKKILVIKLRHIGDVLLTVPVFRALRESFPGAHIEALVNLGTEEVLTGNRLIDGILLLDRSMKKRAYSGRYLMEAAFLQGVRRKKFDLIVDLTGGDRAAILSCLSGARYRIGWKSSGGFIGKKYLYTHQAKPDSRSHTVLQNLEVVRPFGITTEDLSVDLYIPDADRNFVDKLLEECPEHDRPLVHVHPTSRWLFKCWTDSSMTEVIKWLLESGVRVIVTSSPDPAEMRRSEAILSHLAPHPLLVNLCGRTTIKQLGAVARAATLFLGVDSAPMHIAAAVGTPVVALFGPTGSYNWGPWGNAVQEREPGGCGKRRTNGQHTVIQRGWDCVPCGRDGCGGSKTSRCLEAIGVDEVKAAIEEHLKAAEK